MKELKKIKDQHHVASNNNDNNHTYKYCNDGLMDDDSSKISNNNLVGNKNEEYLEDDNDDMGEDSKERKLNAGQVLLHFLKTLMKQNCVIMESLASTNKKKRVLESFGNKSACRSTTIMKKIITPTTS